MGEDSPSLFTISNPYQKGYIKFHDNDLMIQFLAFPFLANQDVMGPYYFLTSFVTEPNLYGSPSNIHITVSVCVVFHVIQKNSFTIAHRQGLTGLDGDDTHISLDGFGESGWMVSVLAIGC